MKQFTSAETPGLPPPDDPPTALDDSPATPPRSRSRRAWVAAAEWALLIGSALLIALLVKTFLFQAFYIPSDSMVPTLKKDDRVIVNKLAYHLHAVHRGDIVVFKTPANVDPSVKDLIKRVIALPGETVAGHDGHIYVDGKVLLEPYLPKGIDQGAPFAAIKVPPDSYWVMGDNRPISRDSRYFPHHFIRKKDIVGRAFVRVWPLTRLGIL